MTEVVILSGKGGTGKTSLVASLAALAADTVVVDCDVDAADLHLLLTPKATDTHDFICGVRAEILPEKCNSCGVCADFCRFGAIKVAPDRAASVDPIACEGCGVCFHFCPEEAIALKERLSGRWFISRTKYGTVAHARLAVAEGNSGRLVSLLRQEARKLAERKGKTLILIDGPPGIGCPVIASVTGAAYVVIVAEPTMAALHDLERLLSLTAHFDLPVGVVVNKADINHDVTSRVLQLAGDMGAADLGRIDYDESVTRAQIAGLPVVEYSENKSADQMRHIWHRIKEELESLKRRDGPSISTSLRGADIDTQKRR